MMILISKVDIKKISFFSVLILKSFYILNIFYFFSFYWTSCYWPSWSSAHTEEQNQDKNKPLLLSYQLEQQATQWIQQKQWDKVIDLLNPHIDNISNSGLLQLASSYQEKKDFSHVIHILTLLGDRRPEDSEVQYMLGDAKLKASGETHDIKRRRQMENEGLDHLRTAISFNKKFRLAHVALVEFYLKTNLNREAIEELYEIQRIFGREAYSQSDLCRLLSLEAFLDQAIRQCQTAIKMNSQLPENFVYLALAYFYKKNFKQVESILVKTAQRFPTSELALYSAGQFFLTKTSLPVAVRYLNQAIKYKTDSIRSQLALAHALFDSQQTLKALDPYIKACQLDSSIQPEVFAAAARLRLKGESSLAARYSQEASHCKQN